MKNKKIIITIVSILVVLLVGLGYYKAVNRASSTVDEPIVIDPNAQGQNNVETDPEKVIISKAEALQLATEQIDTENYTLSIAEEETLKHDEQTYYLIDVVNKSGPSFSMQMAVNQISGEISAYEKSSGKLLPMSEFPVLIPAAQEQDWNGSFLSEDDGGIEITLMQSDQSSFEFEIRYGEKKSFSGIARVEGDKAIYEENADCHIEFIKQGDNLKVKQTGENQLTSEGIKINGDYHIKK